MINIFLNGKKSSIDKSINIHDFIISQGLNDKMIAVAVNMKIIHKNEYKKIFIIENDKLEIVRPVGGG
ncbi:MAG: sulfur carrier protein ThiS [Dehalococcoidales bacterium]|jgi:sulfur carrier protein|nr:sulfur carrier protein ThiS [Dehalococcoidia bacterium]NCG35701.1 sulfur carrier protein ThiS [Dehalococcoidales bacterium]